MEIAILIPTHNNETTIGKVIKDFKKELPKAKVYVYDNDSKDRTRDIASKNGANVVMMRKSGKGRLIKEMFDQIEADYYVLVSPNGCYPAREAHKLIKPVVADQVDMAVGSRLDFHAQKSFTFMQKIVNSWIISFLRFCFPVDIKDMLSEYRVLNKDLVKSLVLLNEGEEIETELTLKTLEEGFKIREIPIYYKEPEVVKKKSSSFMGTVTTIVSLLRDYRPMHFYILASIIPFAFTIGFLVGLIQEYIKYHALINFSTQIFLVFFALLTFLLWNMGFLASGVHHAKKEILYLIKKKR